MIRVLIVDDDDDFRSMLCTMLERLGYDVATATNGKEAIARYRERAVDLVITDLVMPEREGIETIRELCRESPPAKIIAMSGGGRSSPTYLRLASQLGAGRVLSKPFSHQELLDAIAAVLGPEP